MITPTQFRLLALSFPETKEGTHHAIRKFIVKQKIFATLNEPENRACLGFSLEDQHVFCAFADSPFYPVPNKWGQKYGWTLLDLSRVEEEEMLKDALTVAFCKVAPQRLSDLFLPDENSF
jgi:hypothetical protein